MSSFQPFTMERWQSVWENQVECNLSESGVEPLTLGELLALAGTPLDALPLGYGQSNGSPALRAAIAARYPGASPESVVVCNGSAEANFVACWHLIQPGDTVAVLTPTYMQTHGLARNFGARVIDVPLRPELGWQPDPDELRHLLNGRVRLLVATNPGNPTGARLDPAARQAVLDATERTGAWLLADEVYTGAELDGDETPSFFGQHPRVIATGSLSKAYGLAGLRIGWAVAPPELAAELWARRDYTTISPGELTDRLATLALGDVIRRQLHARTRDIIRRGLTVMEPFLEKWGCSWVRPEAGAICFARYPWDIDSAALAERLRVEQSVLIVPGQHFARERYMRLGIGMHEGPLAAALERVDRMAESLA